MSAAPWPLAAKRRKEAHSQYPRVGVNWATLRNHIAPPDYFATCNGDKLRIALRDIVHYELACAIQWQRFKESKVLPLTSNEIHCTVEALHVLRRYLGNFYLHSAGLSKQPAITG